MGSHACTNRTCFSSSSRPRSLFYSSEVATSAQETGLDSSAVSTSNTSLTRSLSNPDLSISSNGSKSQTSSILNGSTPDDDNAVFVVKVYRSDQSSKYFTVHKVSVTMPDEPIRLSLSQETAAKELVMLAITEFGILDQSR